MASEISHENRRQQNKRASSQESESSSSRIKVDLRRAIVGGVIAAGVALVGIWIVGRLSGAEARLLTETTLARLHALCNTVILSSSTILALMLTLLGLSTGTSAKLKPVHYKRIQQLSLLVAVVFVGAMLIFLLLNIPIVEADRVPAAWFSTIYYIAVVAASLLGGSLVAIVLMLYHAVHDLIAVVGLGVEEHAMVDSTETREDENG